MSDNITREPYRNAWYKQLADAVKKHDEEIAEMTPHLVPKVEEGDNGKILIAGEDGAFDWGQPPEELPVITEGDEGKVLKVDEGVPKWLEDSDAEIPPHTASDEGKMLSVNAQNGLEWKNVPTELLLITITENSGTYSADHTFTEIKNAINSGKNVVAFFNNTIFELYNVTTTTVSFLGIKGFHGITGDTIAGEMNSTLHELIVKMIAIKSTGVTLTVVNYWTALHIGLADGVTLQASTYRYLQSIFSNGECITVKYNDIILQPLKSTSDYTVLEFVNAVEGIKATVDANRLVTITEIPKLPAATSADEGKVLMVDSNGDYVLGTVASGFITDYSVLDVEITEESEE